MKILSKIYPGVLAAVVAAYLIIPIAGCKVDAPGLFDPGTLPQPVVDSLSPAVSALAGIDTVTVYGKNFSANKVEDGVYFNSTLVNGTSFYSATTTMLKLKAPALSGDTIAIRVFVIGAVAFSPTVVYQLKPAIGKFSSFSATERAYGVTTGADGNLYASITNSTLAVKDEGIFKINSDGTRAVPAYILPTTSPVNILWSSMKFGPSGFVYGIKGARQAYKLAPGVANPGANPSWAAIAQGSMNDMDFDPDHNLWICGNAIKIGTDTMNILRAVPAGTITGFHFTGTIRGARFYNGSLYVTATVGAANQVWRAPWAADTVQTPQLFFDMSTAYAGTIPVIYAITFSADGDMYLGCDGPDYLIVVHPSGSVERPYGLYVASGVLTSPCKAFAWAGMTLYATTASGGLLKIATGKPGAPYYGIQ